MSTLREELSKVVGFRIGIGDIATQLHSMERDGRFDLKMMGKLVIFLIERVEALENGSQK